MQHAVHTFGKYANNAAIAYSHKTGMPIYSVHNTSPTPLRISEAATNINLHVTILPSITERQIHFATFRNVLQEELFQKCNYMLFVSMSLQQSH